MGREKSSRHRGGRREPRAGAVGARRASLIHEGIEEDFSAVIRTTAARVGLPRVAASICRHFLVEADGTFLKYEEGVWSGRWDSNPRPSAWEFHPPDFVSGGTQIPRFQPILAICLQGGRPLASEDHFTRHYAPCNSRVSLPSRPVGGLGVEPQGERPTCRRCK
jgi:hypothetical protein